MIYATKKDYILELAMETNEVNSMDGTAFQELGESLAKAKQDPETKVIVFSSKREKFFSNGFEPTMFIGKTYEQIHADLEPVLKTTSELLIFPKPIISLIEGHCMGVGTVVALFTDYRIMISGKARIGFPESQIGINFPSVPGFVLKETIGLRNARNLLNSGKALKAPEALDIGLVDAIGTAEELPKILDKYCKQFANMAMESVLGMKQTLRDYMLPTLEELGKTDTEKLAKAVASENGQEGMRSIVERRRPVFK